MTRIALVIESAALEQALQRAPGALARELGQAIGRAVHEMARTARRLAPKAFSTLTNAISGQQPSSVEGLVIAATNYARAVEEGTGVYGLSAAPSGRMPPVQHILEWVRVKRIAPREPGMDERDLAWAIARRIAARGTPAQPFMRPAYEQHAGRAMRAIDAAIRRALAT